MRQRVTIRDVASEANVAVSTVSLYMQQAGRVSHETGQRVAAAIQRLGYVHRSRRVTRGTNSAKQQAALFGLFMEELPQKAFPQTFYGAAIRAIETLAVKHGYAMLFSSIHESNIPPAVLERQVDGAIVLGGGPMNDALAVKLVERNVPLVLLDNYVMGLQVDSICPDNEWGGYTAFKHLADLGHERIAIIEGPRKYKTLTDRLWGALRAAEECGIHLPPEYRQPSISSGYPQKGYREMKQLLGLQQPPSAVFAVSDRAAIGAMEAIREAAWRIPEEISLIGFDDELFSEHATPPLTTIHYEGDLMGNLAMRRLLDLMTGEPNRPVRTNVLAKLVVRGTTAPFSSTTSLGKGAV